MVANGMGLGVWLRTDHYDVIRASWDPTEGAVRRPLQLPADAVWLQTRYTHLQRMIREREKASADVIKNNRPAVSIWVKRGRSGSLEAAFLRSQGASSITLALPPDLATLREWLEVVTAKMERHKVPRVEVAKRSSPKAEGVAVVDKYRLRPWKWCSGLDLMRGFAPASGMVPA
ncbi:hypothetical protein [Actinacidiphila glaucinigra]|uniref:hypothetical protein n=1 Tax=Actinacidiphila glaucinigra TaxID=235986 RepID=UPI003723F1E5